MDTHTVESYSATKNRKFPLVNTQTDLEGVMRSKISQTGKDKSCMISLTCGT